MPSTLHKLARQGILGKDAKRYSWVDSVMDSSVKLHGRNHRRDLVHNPLFIYMLSGGDHKALLAALAHKGVDLLPYRVDREVERQAKTIRTILRMIRGA